MSIFGTVHTTQKLSFLFWKFHWVWRDVGGAPRSIKKITNFLKILLDFSQCQKCIHEGSWVSWTLVAYIRNYKIFYFGSFTHFGVMSHERPKLLTDKMIDFWKVTLEFSQCQKVLEYLRHWSHDSDIISSYLEVSLSLTWCRRNASNYRQNDKFLETCFFVNKLVGGNSFRYFINNQRKSLVTKDNMKFFRLYLNVSE